MGITRRALWDWGCRYLRERGVEEARPESELLLISASGLDRARFYSSVFEEAGPEEEARFREMVGRRGTREPVFYILGEREFWSLPVKVDSRALVPRPESELLVEEAVRTARGKMFPGAGEEIRILDLGTGSGAIALALGKELPEARVWATDISPEALELAEENARRLELAGRIRLAEGDLFAPVRDRRDFFHLIVSNPPYVPAGVLAGLDPEVSRFEPRVALDGGEDGLAVIRRIAEDVYSYLAPRGVLLLEFGDGQSREVLRLFRERGGTIDVLKDLSGRERVLRAERPTLPG